MALKALLDGVRVTKLYSGMFGKMVLTQDVSVRRICYDSRKVSPGDMFVALRGTAVDGHKFILQAMHAGAVVIVVDNDDAVPDTMFMHQGVLKVLVPDSRIALARMSANFYGHPAARLLLVGVTGTNGKTTTTHLVKAVLESAGRKTGLIGTIEYRIGNKEIPATHTTPESLELNELLAEMVREGCTAAVMEVSSHSLAMHRVAGLPFAAGVFTNLTQDHLDFHGTMESYFRAKKLLFDQLVAGAIGVVNADDPYGTRMIEGSAARVITYGTAHGADVRALDISLSISGSRCTVSYGGGTVEIRSALTGRFNIANILAAFGTGTGLGIAGGDVARAIGNVGKVRGRFEQIVSPEGWTAVVDYAHTPDALDNCLRTIREVMGAGTEHRLITVFGCGGNRDKGKRPIMGRIASSMSNLTVVTSDNPRHEKPEAIIEEILAGVVQGKEVIAEPNRRAAIRLALGHARRGDIVLVAGKGHETYQVVGDTHVHFDDREEIGSFIRGDG